MICPDPPDLAPFARTLRYSLVGAGALLAVQFLFPGSTTRVSAWIWSKAWPLARRRALCGLAIFLTVIILRIGLLPRLPVPIPGIHDEFSYLLMADTFAHGRLSNPSHPMWISFETFHVNWFPRYASMYPPLQGIVLAVGQLLGNPWIGVLLSGGAMCAVIYWMLLAWLPPRWALVGGIVAWLKFCVASYWINSYWGGTISAAAGALLLGALGRLLRKPRRRDALLLALGLAILANCRPFEGLLFSLPAGFYLLYWMIRTTSSNSTLQSRLQVVGLPIAAALLVTAAGMTYYNRALTGRWLEFPEALDVKTYQTAPMFLFEPSKPEMEYRNQQFEDFYNGWEREEYDHSWESVWCVTWLKIVRLFSAYCWWGMLLAIPGIVFALRSAKIRLPFLMLLAATVGIFLVVWSNAHYAGPTTCVVILLFLQSLRRLRLMQWRSWRWGAALARASLLLLVADTATAVVRRECDAFYWICQGDVSRVTIRRKLEALPGKHLIMVRYGDDHNIHDEWVYNAADIDASKVIWAREISPEQDGKLFRYYADRKIWLVTPDTDNTYLAPYTPPSDRNSK